MRALHVITNLDHGGAQVSVARIARGLRARGVDAHVVFSSRGGMKPGAETRLADELVRAGVPLHDLPAMRRAPSWRDPFALGQLERLIRRLAPEVVHTHASKAGALGRIAAARAGARRILHSVRGWSWQGTRGGAHALWVALERRLARLTHRFVAVSSEMIRVGVEHGVGRAGDYRVIRSGFELARFTAAHDRAQVRAQLGARDEPVIGTVTRLSPSKAPLDFVAMAAAVSARLPRARFVMVGDGPDRAAVTRAISRAGLRDRMTMLGERDDVPALLAAFDVFVSTSRWEGMPRTVVEAALGGVPIVATDVGGTCEIVRDGVSGVLVPPRSIAALAAGVGSVLADAERARALAARARARVTAEFDIAEVVDRHVALYASEISDSA